MESCSSGSRRDGVAVKVMVDVEIKKLMETVKEAILMGSATW